jgi:hypothetical protein
MLTTNPVSDQSILDEFFNISSQTDLVKPGWLLGMIATYGKTPTELEGFSWNSDNSITVKGKKKPVHPLHPQWVFLFQLKEKQPHVDGCWTSLCLEFEKAVKAKKITLNTSKLLLSHRIRKLVYQYKDVKQPSTFQESFAHF